MSEDYSQLSFLKSQIDQWATIVCDHCGETQIVQRTGNDENFFYEKGWRYSEAYCSCPGCEIVDLLNNVL